MDMSTLREAFLSGDLYVTSVSPTGSSEWKRVLDVSRTEIPTGIDAMVRVTTNHGSSVMTAGHRVFTTPTSKTEADNLAPGMCVLSSDGFVEVTQVDRLPSCAQVYDLTAEDWHNFQLHESRIVVSNSPDRNYRFRPPEHEADIGAYNQVFGYIWEDYELLEYMRAALDWWNMAPPETEYLSDLHRLVNMKPVWKMPIFWGAIAHAMLALSANWISEQFSYSIGGISLDINKSGEYEGLKNNAESKLQEMMEMKARTTKYIVGLKQSRYNMGIRSSFGPAVGRGVMSPRSFL